MVSNIDSRSKNLIQFITPISDEQFYEKLKTLDSANFWKLSSQEVERFVRYGIESNKIQLNLEHLPNSLQLLPVIPDSDSNFSVEQLQSYYEDFKIKNPGMIEQLAEIDADFEFYGSPIKHVNFAINRIIKACKMKNIDQQASEMSMIPALLNVVIKELNKGTFPPEKRAQFLIQIAAGGAECTRGMFTQIQKVYFDVMMCNSPQQRVYRQLLVLRESLFDYQILKEMDLEDEDVDFVEERLYALNLLGPSLGLFSCDSQLKLSNIDLNRLEDVSYQEEIKNLFNKALEEFSSCSESEDDSCSLSTEDKTAFDRFLGKLKLYSKMRDDFFASYTRESIIDNVTLESKENELYQWFIQGPFSEKQETVYGDVVEPNSGTVVRHYIVAMLHEMGVLNFS